MGQQFLAWVFGDLSRQERIWTALAPGIAVTAYFLLGLVPFTVRCLRYGMPKDPEVETRPKTVLVGYFVRHYFFWVIKPLWTAVLWTGMPPTALTTLSLLIGLAAGVSCGAGRFALGGWLFLLSGVLDTLDGRLARARKQASKSGAAIDSVLDRYTDSALLFGLAWYYRGGWVLLPVLLCMVGGALVPYVRARGEGLGISVRDGQMTRLERVLILGVTVALSPVHAALTEPSAVHPMHWPAIVGLCVVGVMANITAVARLVTLVKALAPEDTAKARRAVPVQLGLSLAASTLATLADYAVVLMLAEKLGLTPVMATAAGSLFGAVLNFYFNRLVTFRSGGAQLPQASRYALVSAISALLNSGGVGVLALHPEIDYRWGWWLVRGAVFALWNFPLHRGYVFAQTPVEPEQAQSPAAVR